MAQMKTWNEIGEVDLMEWQVEISSMEYIEATANFSQKEMEVFNKLSKSGGVAEGLLALTMLVQKLEQIKSKESIHPPANATSVYLP